MSSQKRLPALCVCCAIFLYADDCRAVTTGPPTLTFEELITAAVEDPPPPPLQRKMDVLFNTPFISNSGDGGAAPEEAEPGVIRVAEWNIYRTPEDEDARLALTNAPAFLERARRNPGLSRGDLDALAEQLRVLERAEIVILNEIDDGVEREHYRNVPEEMARALHMNYAFAVEFLELNRIYMGVKKMDVVDRGHAGRAHNFGLDPARYLGLEGTALLSRYPVASARIVHLPEAYDWYHDEIRALSDLEKVRRWTAERLFDERILRQVRRGGRLALIVELRVPGAPGGTLTIVCPHLEDYCGSKGRRRQMEYLLTEIRGLKGAVVLGGDLNTLGHNGRPLTIPGFLHRFILNYRFWLREAFYFFAPIPGTGEILRAVNYVKNLNDPTAASVPVILRNPERRLFDDVRSFRFEGGGGFDFSGDRRLSYEHRGSTLADSAQRQWKGFTPSFSFRRTVGGLFGGYKLDWIFVKNDKGHAGENLIPAFGRTLTLVNKATVARISPHSPTALEIRSGETGAAPPK